MGSRKEILFMDFLPVSYCISPSHARGGLHTRRVRKADYGVATTTGMSMERCEAARRLIQYN